MMRHSREKDKIKGLHEKQLNDIDKTVEDVSIFYKKKTINLKK